MLGFLAGNPHTGKTLLGVTPLFGLDPAAREGDRAVGPLTAALVRRVRPAAVSVHAGPAARDAARRGRCRHGVRELADTLRRLPQHRNVAVFLLANMIYADGLVALFAFGGIYAAGTFGWSTIQIGVFGILLTITGDASAPMLGGKLDDRLGPKRVILGSLSILMRRDRRDPVDRARSYPVRHSGRAACAGRGTVCGAGRAILCRDRPADRPRRRGRCRPPRARCWCGSRRADSMTQFFGLFALSGKVTSFTGAAAGRRS